MVPEFVIVPALACWPKFIVLSFEEVILPELLIVTVPKEGCNLIVSARSDSKVPLFTIDTVPLDCCNESAEPGLLALSVTDTVPELSILKSVD